MRVLLVVIVVAAVVVAWLLTRPSGPAYRTAAVATGDAVATLSEVGTITPVQQADLTFAVAGKVGTVDVTVGQQVTAGQTVATLDTTSLQSAVVTAQANLASAQATLASDETTQADGSTTTVTTSTGSGASGTGPVEARHRPPARRRAVGRDGLERRSDQAAGHPGGRPAPAGRRRDRRRGGTADGDDDMHRRFDAQA